MSAAAIFWLIAVAALGIFAGWSFAQRRRESRADCASPPLKIAGQCGKFCQRDDTCPEPRVVESRHG